jgi:hypothetical protein
MRGGAVCYFALTSEPGRFGECVVLVRRARTPLVLLRILLVANSTFAMSSPGALRRRFAAARCSLPCRGITNLAERRGAAAMENSRLGRCRRQRRRRRRSAVERRGHRAGRRARPQREPNRAGRASRTRTTGPAAPAAAAAPRAAIGESRHHARRGSPCWYDGERARWGRRRRSELEKLAGAGSGGCGAVAAHQAPMRPAPART